MNAKEEEILQDGYRFALSLTNNSAEAEDLVQESWLKLYEQKGHIDNRNLLFTTIRNRFIDVWRRKKKIEMVDYDGVPEPSAVTSDPNDTILLERVHSALEELAPKEREALYLQCMEEYTASEISDITGQPRGTVLSLISRGRKKLINILGLSKSERIIKFKEKVS